MSRQANIPITDHNDGDVCSLNYTVRFKQSSLATWTTLSNVQPEATGSPVVYYITLYPLEDSTNYDYEITRNCCEGNVSLAASGTFNSND